MSLLYRWQKKQENTLTDFMSVLNRGGYKYFVLRNYENLPENNHSKDVDIIIEPGKYREILSLLIKVYSENGFTHYYTMNYERAHCTYAFCVETLQSIHVDLIEGYANKGFEIFKFNELYDNTEVYKMFRVLNKSYDSVMLLLYKVIGCKELKVAYREKICEAWKTDGPRMIPILKDKLGDDCSAAVIQCLRNDDFDSLVDMSNDIEKSAKKIAFLSNPLSTFVGICKFILEKCYYVIKCPNFMRKLIVVEAPDGAGKTTFIEALRERIANVFLSDLSKSQVYHFRPSFLPNLSAAGERMQLMSQDRDYTRPHRAKQANFLSSFIRMSYYWMDYFIGMPILLRANARFDKFTIFDRYIYDFLVDPRRSRIGLPWRVRYLFTKLVVQPKLVFILQANPKIVYQRKKELTLDEIERQMNEFVDLAKREDNMCVLSAETTPEDMATKAVSFIIKTFTSKL